MGYFTCVIFTHVSGIADCRRFNVPLMANNFACKYFWRNTNPFWYLSGTCNLPAILHFCNIIPRIIRTHRIPSYKQPMMFENFLPQLLLSHWMYLHSTSTLLIPYVQPSFGISSNSRIIRWSEVRIYLKLKFVGDIHIGVMITTRKMSILGIFCIPIIILHIPMPPVVSTMNSGEDEITSGANIACLIYS